VKHHTKDQSKRAEHISDRLEKIHEIDMLKKDKDILLDWSKYWLNTYDKVKKELCDGLPLPSLQELE